MRKVSQEKKENDMKLSLKILSVFFSIFAGLMIGIILNNPYSKNLYEWLIAFIAFVGAILTTILI